MDIIDYQQQVNYSKELLKFIHSEIGLSSTSKDEIISLIKEHKRIVKSIGKPYIIKSFNSDISLDSLTIEKLNILKRVIDENFDYSKSVKKSIFCYVSNKELRIKSSKVYSYLDLHQVNFYKNLSRFRLLLKNKVFNDIYNNFMKKYSISKSF